MKKLFIISLLLAINFGCQNQYQENYYSENDYELEESSKGTFYGYECTQDCSGHQAGYKWAEEKGITNPNNCGGNSQSFIEGCCAYAEGF